MSLVALSALAVAMPAAAQDSGQGGQRGGGQRNCETAQDPAACRDRQAQQGGQQGQGGQRGGQQGSGQQGGQSSGQSGQQGGSRGGQGGQQGSGQQGGSQQGGSQQGGGSSAGGYQGGGSQSGGSRDDRGSQQGQGGWDRDDNRGGQDRGGDRGGYGRGDDRGGWDRDDNRGIAVGEINGDNFNGAYNQIERKIERGFKTGQLDRRQAWNLALQLGEVRKLDRMFRRDGRIDRRERNELMTRIARLDAQLRFVRMDSGPRRY